jgi:hypothetical protein
MDLDWHVIGAALAGGGATALLLLVVARVQRWRWREMERRSPLAELQRRFRAWEAGGIVILLAFIGACWLALLAIAAATEPADVLMFVGPSPWHWAILAFFAGNVVAIGPTHLLFQHLMGPARYAEFRHYQMRKFGFDSRTWLIPFSLTFGTAIVLVAFKMLAWGATFTGERVILRSFWGDEVHRYDYDQVMEVATLGDSTGTRLVLRFADDRRWSIVRAPDLIEAIARTVSDHSGLPIVRSFDTTAPD